MNDQSKNSEFDCDVVVVGAGPAGSSVAIRLARSGFHVILVERDKFPRHKLCGEFISPECLAYFHELGVIDSMLAAGGERITETAFYSCSGRSVVVPSEWLGNIDGALSLSRAEMDLRMMQKARDEGVNVIEETRVTKTLMSPDGTIRAVRTRSADGRVRDISAALVIDAAGRGGQLSRSAAKTTRGSEHVRFVGFKAHLRNTNLARGRCEIYLFPGGYSGLSGIGNGLSNHCFLISADIVKKYIGQTNKMIEEIVFQNVRAREMMESAPVEGEWLTVSIDRFGLRDPNPAPGLVAVGDAAAFVDPFTGSGMLLALESASILANIISERGVDSSSIGPEWRSRISAHVNRRLRICGMLRRAASVPMLIGSVITGLNASRAISEWLVRSTRGSGNIKKSNPVM